MPLALPAELKKITPFIRRAEELDKDKSNAESRLVAYYCRQYAVHSGIALAQSPEAKTALGNILNDLEKEKTAMAAFTREESKFLCRQFADKIFDKADQEDRAGKASKNTAKTFYAAASFMEILQQFYPDDDQSEEKEEEKKKTVYAKWKATDILKAIKEGRQPTPGGYGEQGPQDDLTEDGETAPETLAPPAPSADLPPASPLPPPTPPSAPVAPPTPPSAPPVPIVPPEVDDDGDAGTEVELGPPPAYPGPSAPPAADSEVFVPKPAAARAPASPVRRSGAGLFGGFGKKKDQKKASKEAIADATELTKFALAALETKDAGLAATRLKQALEALGQ